MTSSTQATAAAPRQLAQVTPPYCRDDYARIVSALGRYAKVQSGSAILTEPARLAILEIGGRIQGLREALGPFEPERDVNFRTDYTSQSLIAAALGDAISPWLSALACELGFAAPGMWRVASRYFHERFGALMDLSPVLARCYRKPLGYAGDFEMMNMIYRNESPGGTLFGRSLDRVALDSEAGRAVRHRAEYLAGKIEAAVTGAGRHRPARILSVAAGPAMELQMILQKDPALLSAAHTQIALLDQDSSALEHARERIQDLAAQRGVEVTVQSINTSIRTVAATGLDDSYDLVYSAGLFDYLRDPVARAAGSRLVDALTTGGTAVIGNFDVANPTRPFMELVLDWPLHHRSADDLRTLFAGLGSGLTIEKEATGVNLFAVISA